MKEEDLAKMGGFIEKYIKTTRKHSMKCKNCKFWEPFEPGNYGYCNKEDKLTDSETEADMKRNFDCLVYSYYEGGSFRTGKNFGCVHFQQKESE